MIKLSPKLAQKITYDELQKYSRKVSRLENIIYYWIDRRTYLNVQLQDWLSKLSKTELSPIYKEFESQYPRYVNASESKKIKYCLAFVKNNLTYKKDSEVWKVSEKWQTPLETWTLKTGDCEDGAILCYFLMRFCGIEDNRMRIVASDVVGGGHCYVVWLSNEDALEYPVDWCYWYDQSSKMTISYQDRPEYFKGKKEWFSFNLKYMFKK